MCPAKPGKLAGEIFAALLYAKVVKTIEIDARAILKGWGAILT